MLECFEDHLAPNYSGIWCLFVRLTRILFIGESLACSGLRWHRVLHVFDPLSIWKMTEKPTL